MHKRYTLIILLLIAVLGGLGYYFGNWATEDKEAAAVKVDKSEAVSKAAPGEGDAALEHTLAEKEPAAGVMEGASAAADEIESGGMLAVPAQSGQSQIMKLIKGAKLLDEATVAGVDGKKTIRVYDVGDNFKYPMVRVETVGAEDGAGQMTAMVADHLIVRVKDPKVASGEVQEWMREMGVEVRKAMHTAGHFLVSPGPASTVRPSFLLESLMKQLGDAVEVAEPDFIVFTTANMPNDNRFNQLWGMHNTGQGYGDADADIDAPEAWDVTTGSRTVKVAVIDTGVDYNHPDLAANMWINPNEIAGDGIDNDGNGFIDDVRGWDFYNDENDPIDTHGHGTHCSGTIGGIGNNGIGVAGVNWEVTIVPIRFLGPTGGNTSDAIDSVNYATRIGVNLSSNSWGGGGYSELLKSAIAAAGEANQLFVAAAGNDRFDNDSWPQYPASYSFEDGEDNIISVASTNANDQLSSFSNYGATSVDIAAPGSEILSSTPANTYSTYSGTSMATPHVAGALALYASLIPDASFQDLKAQLLASTDAISALEGKCLSGGRLNVYNLIFRLNNPFVQVDSIGLSSDQRTASIFSPGETITITPNFKNVGAELAASVQASLSCGETSVEVIEGTIAVGDLERGATVAAPTSFIVKIPSDMETPVHLPFEIRSSDAAGNSWVHNFQLEILTESYLTGTVIDSETGDPIAGVEVKSVGRINETKQTDAMGQYSVNTIDGSYRLEFSKPGYNLVVAEVACPRADPLDIQLSQPRLKPSVESINVELREGASQELSFDLSNIGSGVLNWSMAQGGRLFVPGKREVSHSLAEPYVWNDISTVGERVEARDDTNRGPYDLGSVFNFYDQEFDSIRVCSNGFLSFTSTSFDFYNLPMNSADTPQNSIAFFWDDLNFNYGGSLYYYLNEKGETIFQYDDVSFFRSPGARLSAQVILRPDHSILIYYKEVGILDSATIGLRGVATTDSYQFSYNSASVYPSTTLLFKQGNTFGSIQNETIGSIEDQIHSVRLRLESKGLAPGVYEDFIYIRSNDADGNQLIKIPVTLKVLPAAYFELSKQETLEVAGAADGDNVIEPGERFKLDLYLKNAGSLESSVLTAELITEDSYIGIIESESQYPVIGAGAIVCNSTPFTLDLDPDTPVGHKGKLTLKLTAADGSVSSFNFEIEVHYLETINGTVKLYGTQTPLKGVVVTAQGGLGSDQTETDAEGRFSLKVYAPGETILKARKSNFNDCNQTVVVPASAPLEMELTNPRVRLSQERIQLILNKGEVYSDALLISNRGYGPLDWTVTSGNLLKTIDRYVLDTTVPYVWNDISDVGTPLTMDDDSMTEALDLGFDFSFYGEHYDQVGAGSNGYLSFRVHFDYYYNEPLMAPIVPTGLVSFFWDDLDLSSGGNVYQHQTDDGACIFQYDEAPFYDDKTKTLSAQVVLRDDNSITVYYKKADINNSATIGLKGGIDPSEIIQVAHNTAYVTPESALCFRCEYDRFGEITSALTGSTLSEPSTLQFTVDASELNPGVYRDSIKIRSNDSWGNESIQIPLQIRVYSNTIYDAFLDRHGVPRARRGLRADCDGDGRSNLMEFAFGLNPSVNEDMSVLRLSRDISAAAGLTVQSSAIEAQADDSLDLQYRRRTDASGLVYSLKSSPDLRNWTDLEVLSESRTATSTPDVENVRATVAVDPDKPNCFYRIEVTTEGEN